MNLSPTAFGRKPQPKSCLGVGLVVALHLAGIHALSAGLIQPPARVIENITLKPLQPEAPPELPKPEPLRADKPTLPDVRVIQVPPPIFDISAPQEAPSITVVAAPQDAGPVVTQPGPLQAAPPQAAGKPQTQVQAPGAVCSVMPRPDVPAVNWSGEAVLQVIATVRGGRVVGTDFRVAQGALDGKTKRSLQRSVESALAGYQCQGDAMFQQDFAFRLE